jgi:hypothetical protein
LDFYGLLTIVILTMGIAHLSAQEFARGDGLTPETAWRIETHVYLNNVRNYLGEAPNDKSFMRLSNNK